ncbi:MAG TPA: hypothetical protein VJ506_03420 [Candidatus Limnocylindrales bacterium]|nr:hypothetical protein [Candidatus Limnocylindrales bacterium]
MNRKKAILLLVAVVAIAAAVRHCRKVMAASGSKGAPIDLCARVGGRACGPKERAEEACSDTAALAA